MSKPLTSNSPAPWSVKHGSNKSLTIEDKDGKQIVMITGTGSAEDFANAYLIMASPQMKKALLKLLSRPDDYLTVGDREMIEKALALTQGVS